MGGEAEKNAATPTAVGEVVYRTPDCPTANGREPVAGERMYEVRFPLEDGRTLLVQTGEVGYQNLGQVLLDMMAGTG